jgi:hypothetical protein
MNKLSFGFPIVAIAVALLIGLPATSASAASSNPPAPPSVDSSTMPPGTASQTFGPLTSAPTKGLTSLSVNFSPAGCHSQTDYAHYSLGSASVHGRGICNLPVQGIIVTTTLWNQAWFGWVNLDQRTTPESGQYTVDATPHSVCASTSAHNFYGSSSGVSYEASGTYGGGDSSPVKTFNC